MKKSFMNNLKNFVDSNVRHRIDRVTQNSGNNSNHVDPLSDDLILVERHYDGLRQFCVDTEKKISNMLQSIQISPTIPSQFSTYTQNVHAGFNSLSQNLAQQAVSIASPTTSHNNASNSIGTGVTLKSNDCKDGLESRTSPIDFPTQHATSIDNNVIHPQSNQETPMELSTELNYDTLQKYKKLPNVGFYKSLCKSGNSLKQDSLLATTLGLCSKMQAQLTNLYLLYEQMIDDQCLRPVQQILEVDIPNVQKLKKLYVRAQNDFESIRTKYNIANQKQQQQSQQTVNSTNTSYLVTQANHQQNQTSKLELLKNELDESISRFDQAKDIYEAELFSFVCRELELVDLLRLFYRLQAEYHQRTMTIIQSSMPSIDLAIERTPRKFIFGTPISEHIRCTGRKISPVIELCVYFLHSQGLREEGLFRIPGSSVKIKKLKSGINALFLTLMSLSDLESDQQRQEGHSCIVAMHALFKSSVGQRPQNEQLESRSSQNNVFKSSSSIDDTHGTHASHLTFNQASQNESENNDYIMDVHSIAGLLKLYLRELPEPLFTHALYDSWLDCVSNKSDSTEKRLELFSKVIGQLPDANVANLGHLIKFLSKLANFHEQNKMTSTNLAIAMAPSLIWPKPSNDIQSRCDTISRPDSAQTLNQQMCSFGLSASQHAMILETLINSAEVLFPSSSDFELSDFSSLSLKSSVPTRAGSTRGRMVKSTSPTGLSTASSSSFSSSTSNSTGGTTLVKGHSRKGGSMEGLLGGNKEVKVTLQPNKSTRSIGRPVSVQMRREDYLPMIDRDQSMNTAGKTPPKPPIPIARTHHQRTTVDAKRHLNTSHKPPAPPVPPPTSVRHQQERLKMSSETIDSIPYRQVVHKPRPVSLRGTGTVEQLGTLQQVNARPSVPPPERPATAITNFKHESEASDSSPSCDNLSAQLGETDLNKDAESLTSRFCSSVPSLDRNGDSSFDDSDEDTGATDLPQPKCLDEHATTITDNEGTLKRINDSQAKGCDAKKLSGPPGDGSNKTTDQAEVEQSVGGKVAKSVTKPELPAKPLQNATPKLTQSTPL